jgi:hypothetical protein
MADTVAKSAMAALARPLMANRLAVGSILEGFAPIVPHIDAREAEVKEGRGSLTDWIDRACDLPWPDRVAGAVAVYIAVIAVWSMTLALSNPDADPLTFVGDKMEELLTGALIAAVLALSRPPRR